MTRQGFKPLKSGSRVCLPNYTIPIVLPPSLPPIHSPTHSSNHPPTTHPFIHPSTHPPVQLWHLGQLFCSVLADKDTTIPSHLQPGPSSPTPPSAFCSVAGSFACWGFSSPLWRLSVFCKLLLHFSVQTPRAPESACLCLAAGCRHWSGLIPGLRRGGRRWDQAAALRWDGGWGGQSGACVRQEALSSSFEYCTHIQ